MQQANEQRDKTGLSTGSSRDRVEEGEREEEEEGVHSSGVWGYALSQQHTNTHTQQQSKLVFGDD